MTRASSSPNYRIFPFREEEPRGDGQGYHLRPTLDLTISNEAQEIDARVLVDTGSPGCIFGRAVAEALYIDLNVETARPLSILGNKINATRAHVTLSFNPPLFRSWQVEAAFLHSDLNVTYIGVLGTEGFLDRWVTTFNYYDRYFVIEDHDSWVDRSNIDLEQTNLILEQYDDDWSRPTAN